MKDVGFDDELRGIAECCECNATKTRIAELLSSKNIDKDYAGPAFPSRIRHEGAESIIGFLGEQVSPGETSNYAGMSLRDYFAAKAMQAAIESQLHDGGDVPEENIPKFFELVAGYAYIAADAMLAERAK